MLKSVGAALVGAALLCGCATSFTSEYDKPNGRTLLVSKQEWDAYQTYLSKVGATNHGAFAVAVYNDKTTGYGYSDCPGSSCFAGPAFASEAMRLCREGGDPCIIFAMNNAVVVNYKLAQ